MSKYKDNIKIASSKGYHVDYQGNVFYQGKIRKCQLKNSQSGIPYYKFNIRFNGQISCVKVHQLQAYQKYGDEIFKQDMVVRHLNGNSLDNTYDNIAIGSASDNMMDIPEDVRKQKAKHASSFMQKYNHDEVYEFYQKTNSYKKTMEQFGITSKNGLHHIIAKFKKNK